MIIDVQYIFNKSNNNICYLTIMTMTSYINYKILCRNK